MKILPFARHHNPLLIRNRSRILTIHKGRIFWKKLLQNREIVFQNGVKRMQAAAYNDARTVFNLCMGHHYSKVVARQITFNSNSCTEQVTSPENATSCFAVRVQNPEPSLLEGKSPASGEIFKHKIQLYKAIS